MNDRKLSLLEKWFEGFNKKDLDLLLSLYDENAEHFSPKLKIRKPETLGWIKGKEALREWWADAFHRLPDLHYTMNFFLSDSDRIFTEYTRITPGEEDIIVGEVLFLHSGRIIRSKVFHS